PLTSSVPRSIAPAIAASKFARWRPHAKNPGRERGPQSEAAFLLSVPGDLPERFRGVDPSTITRRAETRDRAPTRPIPEYLRSRPARPRGGRPAVFAAG